MNDDKNYVGLAATLFVAGMGLIVAGVLAGAALAEWAT